MHPVILRTTLGLVVAVLAACGQAQRAPELAKIYNRSAQADDTERNPVIVIPGILGSKLVENDTGVMVWGAFGGGSVNPEKPDGAQLVAVPMAEGVPLADLRDNVVPGGVLDDVHVKVMFLPLELSAYRNILASLGVGGYRDEALGEAGAVDYGDDHFTCFQFDYDWRRDNVENAQRLHAFIKEKKAYVERELEARYGATDEIKFDIVAHSMGGLLSRYFLRYGDAELPDEGPIPAPTWAGAADVERVILVGTPNAGSAEAIDQLVEGTTLAPFLPTYHPAILGTMPAIYQLLPRERHRPMLEAGAETPKPGLYDVAFWEEMGWGLFAPDQEKWLQLLLPEVTDPQERRAIARDHVEKCLRRAKRFHAALDSEHAPPDGSNLYLFAGDAVPTLRSVTVDSDGHLRAHEAGPGDGTVLRSSAVLDERLDGEWSARLRTPIHWTHVQFLFDDHLGLTKSPAFTDNVLYLLLESPRAK